MLDQEYFFDLAMRIASDRRTTCEMTSALILAQLQWHGDDAKAMVDRSLFLEAIPNFDWPNVHGLLKRSSPRGIFKVDLYNKHLRRMTDPKRRAAVASVIIYHDMLITEEPELANQWIAIHLENSRIPTKYLHGH